MREYVVIMRDERTVTRRVVASSPRKAASKALRSVLKGCTKVTVQSVYPAEVEASEEYQEVI
jgi:hypothetical protein